MHMLASLRWAQVIARLSNHQQVQAILGLSIHQCKVKWQWSFLLEIRSSSIEGNLLQLALKKKTTSNDFHTSTFSIVHILLSRVMACY